MEKRIKIELVVLLVAVAVVCGWFILISRLQVSEEGFGIYFLENDHPVISDKDIISYNKTSHEIKLTEEGVEKIRALSFEVPLYGKPFVVKLDGRKIYNGSFWSPISSIAPPGIVIDTLLQDDIIKIENPPSFQGVEPRDNSEIFDHFQKVGKLTQ